MKESFDQEILYSYLQNRRWKDFLSVLSRNKKEITSNPTALNATKYFLSELFKNVNENQPELYLEEFDMIILLHAGKYFVLDEDDFRKVIKFKLDGQDVVNSEKAYNFARNYMQYDFAKNYCEVYESRQPEKVSHSNEDKISVVINKNISEEDFTIPLFKSNRERIFFNALKDYFPNYHTYPNVAVSSVIDFNKISTFLTSPQKDYFLKSIIDCVIFDPSEEYKPKYFFEIDSDYHDEESIKQKDEWKDLFFSLSGKKLYRIRPIDNQIDKEMFLTIIKEVFVR